MRLFSKAAAVGSLVLLTGCVTVYGPYYSVSSPSSFLSYAAAGNDFRVVVSGNPFTQPDAEVAQSITDKLNRKFRYLNTNFTVTPDATEVPPYKMVFAFNPPLGMSADTICADPVNVPSAPSGDKLRILAAFCERTAMIEVKATVPATNSVTSTDVQDALIQLVVELSRDPVEIKRPFTATSAD